MPIIFENRLGNSESDQKLRKIYRSHNIMWRIYYTIFLAGAGGVFAYLSRHNPLLAIFIILFTLIAVVLLILSPRRRQYPRRNRGEIRR